MAGASGILLQDEVAAVDSCAVGIVKDEAAVAEERRAIVGGRDVRVVVLSVEAVVDNVPCSDLAMLSREISDLTVLWSRGIARDRIRRAAEGYQMRTSCCAVAIVRNSVHMNVVR